MKREKRGEAGVLSVLPVSKMLPLLWDESWTCGKYGWMKSRMVSIKLLDINAQLKL